MPQMSPINWFIMFMITLSLYLLIMTKIYFSSTNMDYNQIFKTTKSLKSNTNLKSWMW